MVPLKPNHKTQMLFISLFTFIILTQIFVITPSKYLFISYEFLIRLGNYILCIFPRDIVRGAGYFIRDSKH